MGIRSGELNDRITIARTDLKTAIRSFAEREGIDMGQLEANNKSLTIELGYDEKSLPFVPGAIKRLVKSAYTDQFPVWAVRLGLVHDPNSPHRPPGEQYVTTIDIAVHGHKHPSARELEEGKISVGKRESLYGPVIAIEADIEPLRYMVERTPLFQSSRTRPFRGTHHIGAVGPAVIEACVKILNSFPRIDPDTKAKQLLEQANYGRARRAAGAIREFIYPKVGRATQSPTVRVEIYTPSLSLF